MASNPLGSVYFISLPEGFSLSDGALQIDPDVPLPVQQKSDAPADEAPDLADITQEQILAGLLTVLAYDKKNPHVPYYRSLVLKARPDIKAELSEAAILKTRNEDWDMAEELFAVLSGIDPDDMAVVLNTALFFDQRADSFRAYRLTEDADAHDETALRLYKKCMDAEPPLPDAFFNAGFFYLKQRDFARAQDCFETYLALTVDVPDSQMGENGLYKKERAQEIIGSIKSSNLADSRFKVAFDLISEDKVEEGLDTIRVFLQDNPDVWNAWFMTGWGLRKLGRYQQAQQAFCKALELGGDANPDTYNELAICQMEQNQLDAARGSLFKALALEPEDTKVISNLGYVYMKLGDSSEARRYFATVLELDPHDKIARLELAKLEER